MHLRAFEWSRRRRRDSIDLDIYFRFFFFVLFSSFKLLPIHEFRNF